MNTQRGFVALMTAVIVSAILLVLTVSVSFASFYARADKLGELHRAQALALARSCVNVALRALAAAPSGSYAPHNLVVNVGSDESCIIQGVAYSGGQAKVATYASAGNSFATIAVTVALSSPIKIIAWDESH